MIKSRPGDTPPSVKAGLDLKWRGGRCVRTCRNFPGVSPEGWVKVRWGCFAKGGVPEWARAEERRGHPGKSGVSEALGQGYPPLPPRATRASCGPSKEGNRCRRVPASGSPVLGEPPLGLGQGQELLWALARAHLRCTHEAQKLGPDLSNRVRAAGAFSSFGRKAAQRTCKGVRPGACRLSPPSGSSLQSACTGALAAAGRLATHPQTPPMWLELASASCCEQALPCKGDQSSSGLLPGALAPSYLADPPDLHSPAVASGSKEMAKEA